MRYIRRPREPELLRSPMPAELRDELWAFHLGGGQRMQQKVMPARPLLDSLWEAAREPVVAAFGGYCAYTEVDLADGAELMLHRPASDAVGLEGEASPDHYFWLATEWSNWYAASPAVARIKGTFFPVHGSRSPVPAARSERTRLDRGLILDPCNDRPEWWLRPREDGTYEPVDHPSEKVRARFGDAPRGAITIDALGLNESRLVEERRLSLLGRDPGPEAIADGPHAGFRRQLFAWELLDLRDPDLLDSSIHDWLGALVPELSAALVLSADDWTPGAAALDTALWQRVEAHAARLYPDLVARLHDLRDRSARRPVYGHDAVQAMAPEVGAAPPEADAAPGGHEPPEAAAAPAVREPGAPPERAARRAAPAVQREPLIVRRGAQIESVLIKNFRAIDQAEIGMGPGGFLPPVYGEGTSPLSVVGAKALLGENGSGKSSVLQAIALALAGDRLEELSEAVGLRWDRLLRRAPGVRQGRIVVRLTGGQQIDLRFSNKRHWFVGGAPEIRTFVRAYGATRALPAVAGDNPDALPAASLVRVENLFDPRRTLRDAERWLLEIDEGDFNVAAVALRHFLDLPEERRCARDGDAVLIDDEPLALVSDGYRAVISLVCDVMAGSGEGLSAMSNATGVVLVDELGAHLHPRWRMNITRRFRSVFPHIQFVYSTHEPLCLRGLLAGEVVHVERDPKQVRVVLDQIERSPSDYRVDQLLTSEFFGLGTTLDPDKDRRIQAYYHLLEIPEAQRTPAQQAELERVGPVPTEGVLGATRRDQLVYEVIDHYLAAADEQSPEQRRVARAQAIAAAADVWREVRRMGEAGTP